MKSLASADGAACVIVKHANPCGAAIADTPLAAYRNAFATDPVSAFGGIIAFNRPVDAPTLEAVSAQFLEVLIAPGYTADALAVIAQKKNVRVLEVPLAATSRRRRSVDLKRIGGGLLAAERRCAQRDRGRTEGRDARRRRPTSSCATCCSRGASRSS